MTDDELQYAYRKLSALTALKHRAICRNRKAIAGAYGLIAKRIEDQIRCELNRRDIDRYGKELRTAANDVNAGTI